MNGSPSVKVALFIRNGGSESPCRWFYITGIYMDRSETEQYIASHMDYSGCAQEVFTTKALDEIHKASAGIPRMINRICEKALMYAFQNQKRLIDDYMVKYVVEHEMLGTMTT